jgi:hypothetical protein
MTEEEATPESNMVVKNDTYSHELRSALGGGAPTVLLGTSRRALDRYVAQMRNAEAIFQKEQGSASLPDQPSEAPHSLTRRTEPTETKLLEAIQAEDVADADAAIHRFNAENSAHEELWLRSTRAGDQARRAQIDASQAESKTEELRLAYLAIQAENPGRHAPLPRQLAIVGIATVLSAGACYYAAQGLGLSQLGTLTSTGMLLAVLVCGELALDYFRDRSRTRWRVLAVGLAVFMAGLGALRYYYVTTILGASDALAAAVGATLLVLVIASSAVVGSWALRNAETSAASHARRQARRAAKAAAAAREQVHRHVSTRDRLVDAYIARIRALQFQDRSDSRLPLMEAAIRAHLLGEEPADSTTSSRLRHEQEHPRNPAQGSG